MRKEDVIRYFGGITAVAKVLDVSYAAVHKWLDTIPQKRAFMIERLTNGALKYEAHLYKPDAGGKAQTEQEVKDGV